MPESNKISSTGMSNRFASMIAPYSKKQAHRVILFNEPPDWMLDELSEWRTEHRKERCMPGSHLECTKMEMCLDFKPRISIINMLSHIAQVLRIYRYPSATAFQE